MYPLASADSCGLGGTTTTTWAWGYALAPSPSDKYHGWWACHQLENTPPPPSTRTYTKLASIFDSAAELLEASPAWFAYLDAVYGVDTIHFPFHLSTLTYFYSALLPTAAWGEIGAVRAEAFPGDDYGYGDFKHAQYPHCMVATYGAPIVRSMPSKAGSSKK